MATSFLPNLKQVLHVQWKLSTDLAVVGLSWLLVVGALYTATVIVGTQVWGGMTYFVLYAIVGATLFGVGIPLYWMVVVRKRALADLGVTRHNLLPSLALQAVFAILLYFGIAGQMQITSMEQVLPLIALALTIGFFEAFFWRGWVQLRLEEAFGVIPAILGASALYAVYHIGYAMPLQEIVFLFFIGIMFAAAFRLTKNIFILYPLFQPMGQLVTLLRDGLSLPLLAALGFVEVLIVMFVLVWLAARYHKKHST